MPTVRQKGYSAPIALIALLALLAVPAYFWFSLNDFNFSSQKNIKGVAYRAKEYTQPGFSVSVASASPTWELSVFLCKDATECSRSLSAGYRFATISGGATEFYEVPVLKDSSWNEFNYVKYYVRPGWEGSVGAASVSGAFGVTTLGDLPASEVLSFDVDAGGVVNAVVFPTTAINATFYRGAHLTNQK